MIWSTPTPTTDTKPQSRSSESSETPTTVPSKLPKRTDFPSWPPLTTEQNLMAFNPAKIAIWNPKRATRVQDHMKLLNLKRESTCSLMFLNQLILILIARRRSATSVVLNTEKKMRMTTLIFLKFSQKQTQILIRTRMIFTITPMYSLPLKGSIYQEKGSLRKTQCDHHHHTVSGKEWVLWPAIGQSKI